MALRRVLASLLIVGIILGGLGGLPSQARAQTSLTAQSLLNQMTPAQKIGQLMLVTFEGTNTSQTSAIYDLISRYHIGGIVLSADNNNFENTQTVLKVNNLTQSLQTIAYQKSLSEDATLQNAGGPYVPLFIGIPQSESPDKVSQILEGVTQLPSPMAIGATWSPSLATEVGKVAGSELSTLGFNLYLGPNLDVVDSSDLRTSSYSGTLAFGGDPYWVGEMGKAYIDGLHEGSNGKLAIIPSHFPGLGGADRPILEEVSTVQKSLEQLKQIELAPYLEAVDTTEQLGSADGLMVSHIRFQGFQGNIRATTRPVSFDPDALAQLLSVEPLPAWREAGGVMVSDNLGSRAVRYFFDPTGRSYDANNIARTAFLAGNDLLYLNNILGTGDTDSFETIKGVLAFFAQKYQEDSVFAERVDASVGRILNLKLKLYPDFNSAEVLNPGGALDTIGSSGQVAFNVAQEAVTLIHPESSYLRTNLAGPPSTYESIVIFTDVREQKQCDACAETSNLGLKSFQNTLLRLYGPQASQQILENRLYSYSFAQLVEILDRKTEPLDPYVIDNLKQSQWVIFNLDATDPNLPASLALQRLLSERPDLIADKTVIVFSYGAPYYLDSTAVTKLTAYYALYSKGDAFVEIAARILMQESQARGALPISLPLIGYNLNNQTAPDPNQVIPIQLLAPITPPSETEPTPSPVGATPLPLFQTGETIQIQAGVIRDKNSHLVPDGTVVRFTVKQASDNTIIAQPIATTSAGLAIIAYRIDREGIFEVTAVSEPALTSGTLVLNTQGGRAEVIMPTPTPTAMPTATPQPSPTIAPTIQSTPPEPEKSGFPRMQDWLLVVMILIMGFGLSYLIGNYWWGGMAWGLRSGVATLIGGFVAYILLTIGFSSLEELVKQDGTWFIVQLTFVGMFFGWLVAFAWWLSTSFRQTPHKD
ncbi:MAG: glycoside hydrolase family 3 N-terminal domain-containing protein [Anaerolineaceae bacterium]